MTHVHMHQPTIKEIVCKNKQKELEIYLIEDAYRQFSVCLQQKETFILYGTFQLRNAAKEMAYWVTGQCFTQEAVTVEAFTNALLASGNHKWCV